MPPPEGAQRGESAALSSAWLQSHHDFPTSVSDGQLGCRTGVRHFANAMKKRVTLSQTRVLVWSGVAVHRVSLVTASVGYLVRETLVVLETPQGKKTVNQQARFNTGSLSAQPQPQPLQP